MRQNRRVIQVPKLPNQNKNNAGVAFRMGCFFAANSAFLDLFGGQKNLLAFNFLSLFRAYGSLRYVSLVSPYHVLLLCIGHSHLFIQAVDLFCKTSAGPLTNVYLKLN